MDVGVCITNSFVVSLSCSTRKHARTVLLMAIGNNSVIGFETDLYKKRLCVLDYPLELFMSQDSRDDEWVGWGWPTTGAVLGVKRLPPVCPRYMLHTDITTLGQPLLISRRSDLGFYWLNNRRKWSRHRSHFHKLCITSRFMDPLRSLTFYPLTTFRTCLHTDHHGWVDGRLWQPEAAV